MYRPAMRSFAGVLAHSLPLGIDLCGVVDRVSPARISLRAAGWRVDLIAGGPALAAEAAPYEFVACAGAVRSGLRPVGALRAVSGADSTDVRPSPCDEAPLRNDCGPMRPPLYDGGGKRVGAQDGKRLPPRSQPATLICRRVSMPLRVYYCRHVMSIRFRVNVDWTSADSL